MLLGEGPPLIGSELSSHRIATAPEGNTRVSGFGFVEMADDTAAQSAIAALNGSEVDGRNIVVNESGLDPEGGGSGGGGGPRIAGSGGQ